MAGPLAEKKTDEIIYSLSEILNEGLYNDFTLKRYKIETKKLKEAGVFLDEIFIILGMIACIEGNIEEMHSYHRSAIGYSGETYSNLFNYSVSLLYCSLYKESYEYALKAFDIDKNEKVISIILYATYFLNRKKDFKKFAEFYEKLYRKEHQIFSSLYVPLRNTALPMSYSGQISKVRDIISRSTTGIVKYFGLPQIIELEVMGPVDGVEEQWIAWIMSLDDIEEGLDKMDMFHDWCIENQIDEDFKSFNFNIDFLVTK